MSVKQMYNVNLHETTVFTNEIKEFVKKNHYSGKCRSLLQKYIFKLEDVSGKLTGVCIYGLPVSVNARGKYGENILELRKLCLIDDTPKNTESFFIGKTLRYLKKNTEYDRIISYADPNMGHEGTIYKASNFEYKGMGKYWNELLLYNDEVFHKRHMYQKRNGVYAKKSLELQRALKSGKAELLPQMPKHIYIYDLKRR